MNAGSKVVPRVDGLEVNEYHMPGIQRGNEDIETSSVSVEFPPLSDEQINEGNGCEARR